MGSALAVQQSRGRPRSRLYVLAHRIAARFEPAVAQAFLRSIDRLQRRIDEAVLRSALASQSIAQIEAAVGANELELILLNSGLSDVLARTATTTGQAGASVLSDVLGLDVSFNATDPNAILYARQQSGILIRAITDDVREAVRIIVASGQAFGLTIDEQAVAIRQLVGLPPNWVNAPLNLAQEIRDGTVNYDRRLSAIDKAKIRSRIKQGTVTDAFVREMQGTYSKRLINRRALNIARTESLRSANFGQRENWRQARRNNVLPQTARRSWIVTPDDRLRETHAAVPGMNPDGVPIDGGVYQTPLGPSDGPPLEVNCRCSEGLIFPGFEAPAAPSRDRSGPAPRQTNVPRFANKQEALQFFGTITRRVDRDFFEGLGVSELQAIADGTRAALPQGQKIASMGFITGRTRALGRATRTGGSGTRLEFRKSFTRSPVKQSRNFIGDYAANKAAREATLQEILDNPATATALRTKTARDLRHLQAATRWTVSSESPLRTVASHETTHAVWNALGRPDFEWREALDRHGATTTMMYRVSEYAASNRSELFSEVGALVAEGRATEVPSPVLAAFREIFGRTQR